MEKEDSFSIQGKNIPANPESEDYGRLVRTIIKENFKHVFDNKEEEWAKQTLVGLNKIMNIFVIQLDSAEGLPGTLTMEDINPNAESPIMKQNLAETNKLQSIDEAKVAQKENEGGLNGKTEDDDDDDDDDDDALSGPYIQFETRKMYTGDMDLPPWEKIFEQGTGFVFPYSYNRNTMMLKLAISIKHNFSFLGSHKENPLAELIINKINKVYNFEQRMKDKPEKDGPYKFEMRYFDGYDSDKGKEDGEKISATRKKRKSRNDK